LPKGKIVVAFFATFLLAGTEAVFGFLVVNNMFALMDPDFETMVVNARMWSAIIFGMAFLTFIGFWGSKS
jgi:hypothetical protein